jgi:2-polyprenyl-6-methoxyphenol hydroxylase-like FAD-dependent oxidoreductase
MKRALDVAIVGYGIAGIAAAIRLRRLGHRITHFDRNNPPAAVGAGMLLHPPAIRQLDQLGVMTDAVACGAPVRRICAQTVHGRPLMDFRYGDVLADQFGLGIQRATLHQLLASADGGRNQVCCGRKIISLDPVHGYVMDEQRVRHGQFDLIVVADGANSLLRKWISSRVRYDRCPHSAALVGLLDDPDLIAGDCLQQYFDSGRHISVWPAGCESPDSPPRCSFAINVPRSEAVAFRDTSDWRNLVTRLCPRIGKLVNESVQNTALHIFTYRDVELSQCVVGRAVVIGDAAHSMSPQLGTGAQLAMEDAALLATAVSQHGELSDALHFYALTRPRQLRRYHRASRWLTPLLQSDSRLFTFLRDHLFANAMRIPFVMQHAYALLT